MFKMLTPKFFVIAAAWAALLAWALLERGAAFLAASGVSLTPKFSYAILAVQGAALIVFSTPLWRWFWTRSSFLRGWYPDLNGEWDLIAKSNWSRIEELVAVAGKRTASLDIIHVPDADLPPLLEIELRAKITQSWLKIEMSVFSATGSGPIFRSKTLSVDPFRSPDGCHGLTYVFEQENDHLGPSDDRVFRGAARVEVVRDNPDVLCGRMWTDRMWKRGMNTAADIKLTRRP